MVLLRGKCCKGIMRVRGSLSGHAMEGEGEPLAGTEATLVSTMGWAGRAFGETVLGASLGDDSLRVGASSFLAAAASAFESSFSLCSACPLTCSAGASEAAGSASTSGASAGLSASCSSSSPSFSPTSFFSPASSFCLRSCSSWTSFFASSKSFSTSSFAWAFGRTQSGQV
ncbi:hypothetical protein BJY59DRAFT_690871 [Rhodotorula toruloides]